jgi:hypothetical protein
LAVLYVAWVRPSRGPWRVVAEGRSLEVAYRGLLAWVGRQPHAPLASKILPAGTQPAPALAGTRHRPILPLSGRQNALYPLATR